MVDKAGIVGIGIMGSAMANNMIQAGLTVVGYDPSPAAQERFVRIGGRLLESPRAVADEASVIVLSLPNPQALADAVFGRAGFVEAGSNGQIAIECSTLELAAKREALERMQSVGMTLLDCPVSGTGAQAKTKDLVVFASGEEGAFRQSLPVLESISRSQHYLGSFGSGSMMKYIANHLVTIHNAAAAEAMVLAMKAGLDPAVVYDTLRDSAGSSRMFQIRGPLMRDGVYEPATATVRTHLKDMSIIEGFASEVACALPVYSAAAQLYHAGNALGFSKLDTASVCAVLQIMNGVTRKQA